MTTTSHPTPAPAAPPTEERQRPRADKAQKKKKKGSGRPSLSDTVAAGRPAPGVRVSRVIVRRIDPWSVLKVSMLFYLCMFVVLLIAGILLWAAAAAIGVIENFESFMSSIGFTDFRFLPAQILRVSALGGLVLVLAGTAGNVLMTVLYNLISDVVGGLRMTLADDDRPRRTTGV
jgi:hypothetical protein